MSLWDYFVMEISIHIIFHDISTGLLLPASSGVVVDQ